MKVVLWSLLLALLGSKTAHSAELSYQPEVIRSDENGMLEVTLEVDMVESLQGIEWSDTKSRIAPGYNGLPIGPTLIVKPGDTLKITLVNNLPAGSDLDKELYDYVLDPESDENNVTIITNRLSPVGAYGAPAYGYWGLNYMNLHFHGMSLPWKEEKIMQALDGGGERREYNFQLPEDQEPGIYWYHNHAAGTAAYSYLASLMGFIVVEGNDATNNIAMAPGVEDATEIFMMLSEGLVNPDGSVPPVFPIVMQFNWTSVVNGHLPEATTYDFEQGEKALFHANHAGVEPYIYLSIPGHKMIVVGLDGMPVPSPMEVEEIQLHGGQRVDFLVQFDTPGTFIMTRAPWNALPSTDDFCLENFGIPFAPCISYAVERDVLTINVAESTTPMTKQALTTDSITLPEYSDRLKALAEQPSVATKDLLMQQDVDAYPLFQIPFSPDLDIGGFPTGFGFNGRFWNPFYVQGTVQAGTCETWTVSSFPPGTYHPFHSHTADFLVLEKDGVAVDEPYWRDTETFFGTMKIHICFDKVEPGDMVMVHCHMPIHSDVGMMTQFEVIEGPTPAPVPQPGPGPGPEPSGSSDDPDDGAAAIMAFESTVGAFVTLIIAAFLY